MRSRRQHKKRVNKATPNFVLLTAARKEIPRCLMMHHEAWKDAVKMEQQQQRRRHAMKTKDSIKALPREEDFLT